MQRQHDVQGQETGLHYIRTKDGAELDFALDNKGQLTHLVECKLSDPKPHRALPTSSPKPWRRASCIAAKT